MGIERRREPRIQCGIPCELRIAGVEVAGKVRNVSASGLGVVAEAPDADQGEDVVVNLRVPGRAPMEVRALVWHVREMRGRASDKSARLFGLVLSDAAPDFARLVERLAAGRVPRAEAPPKRPPPLPPRRAAPPAAGAQPAAPEAEPEAQAAPPAPRQYRIRLKQIGGSRSYRIVASGESAEAAAEAAQAEVGPGWTVLEVLPV
jgi:hypothetical protein